MPWKLCLCCHAIENQRSNSRTKLLGRTKASSTVGIKSQEVVTSQSQVQGQGQNDEIQHTIHQLKTENHDTHKNLKMSGEIHRLENENHHMNTQIKNMSGAIQGLKNEKYDMHENLEKMSGEMHYLKKECNERQRKEHELNQEVMEWRQQLAQKERQYEALHTRFSKMASEQVTSGNTDIEDLSDSNRPLKLAERFRHGIYGSEWCNAFEELSNFGMEDEDIVRYLFEMCRMCYEFCKERASEELNNFEALLSNRFGSNPTTRQRPKSTSTSLMQAFIQERKVIDSTTVDSIVKNFLMQLKEMDNTSGVEKSGNQINLIQPFIRSCISCCSLMRVQDPPMALLFNVRKGEAVDKARFEIYQTPGNDVDYIVWPAVVRDENGALLQKGIVEAIKDKTSRRSVQIPLPATQRSAELIPPNSAEVSAATTSSAARARSAPSHRESHSPARNVTQIDVTKRTTV